MYVSALLFQTVLLLMPAVVAAVAGSFILHARRAGRIARAPQLITACLLTTGLSPAFAAICRLADMFWRSSSRFVRLPSIVNRAYSFRRLATRRWDLALLGMAAVLLACAFWQLNSWTTVDLVDLTLPQRPQELRRQKAVEFALTDRGRQIPLFELSPESKEKFFMTGDQGLPPPESPVPYRSIRLTDASGTSNCVGWVFVGGRYEMQCNDVAAILEDNGYLPVKNPQVGDLIIYRDENAAVTHAGSVALLLDTYKPLVESKWGAQGVFLHLPKVLVRREGDPLRSPALIAIIFAREPLLQDEGTGSLSEDP